MPAIQKINACLWFDKQAEEAAKYYISIFPNSGIGRISHYTKAGYEIHKMEAGTVLAVEFTLDGQQFMALNGGPAFRFTEAVSFVVHCAHQKEVDSYWEKLSAGGDPKAQQCGWVKDKYGLSWQIVPEGLMEMHADPDPVKAGRVMEAMMQMKKLDIAELKRAYNGS
jgi:predicted 3-demethylubiquinone-9 3-methyltransferase (glyoxalase superfamily)